MNNGQRRLNRAIRVTPRAERTRRIPEWQGDFDAATLEGREAGVDVAKGAERVAWSLRRRQFESLLTGDSGALPAALSWLFLLCLTIGSFLLGGPILLLFGIVATGVCWVLARSGSPSHISHWVMVASALTWLACVVFVWWAAGEKLEAADAMRPEAAWAQWGGEALLLGLLAFAGFVTSVVIAVSRARRR